MNPQGKMPLLLLPDGTALPESEVQPARGSSPGGADVFHTAEALCSKCTPLSDTTL
jgi:hypothetical protein